MSVKVEFVEKVSSGDPAVRPCTILGKKNNLQSLPFGEVSPYLGDKVTNEVGVA
jgi:hypothetical protein